MCACTSASVITLEPAAGSCCWVCTFYPLWPLLLPTLVPAAGPGGTAKDPQQPLQMLWMPTELTRHHTVVNVVDPSGWANETSCPSVSRDATCPMPWHPGPLDLESQHTPVCPHLQMKCFPYWSQSIRLEFLDYFRCADTYTGYKESANTSPPMEIQALPNEVIKIIVP